MGPAIVLLLALICAAAIGYPLLSGRRTSRSMAGLPITDADIEKAVRQLREAQGGGDLHCPQCGTQYRAGDRFCVRCGQDLPQDEAVQAGPACPSCGAAIHKDDRFCAKCGHVLIVGEAA